MSHTGRHKWRLFCLALTLALPLLSTHAQTVTLTIVGEVRWSDAGWGPYNDQNLAGRFSTQTFIHAWPKCRTTSCGNTMRRLRPNIRDTRRRCMWIIRTELYQHTNSYVPN
jgi:hypothetical protein